jgi:hypothetical protein
MEYHKTRYILHIMQFLGHRNIKNTLVYTRLVDFENDDYHSAMANTVSRGKQTGRGRVRVHVHLQRHAALQKTQVNDYTKVRNDDRKGF